MTRFLLRTAFVLLVGIGSGVRVAHAQAPAGGTTPNDQFHRAARLFVAGDSAGAVRAVEAGLRQAPRDPQLQALLAEIRRRPPPQPPRNNGTQNRNQNRNPQGQPPRPPQQPPREQPPPQRPPQQQPRPQQPREQTPPQTPRPQQTPRTPGQRPPQPQTPRPGAGQPRTPQQQPRAQTPRPGTARPTRPGQGPPPSDATGTGRAPQGMTRAEAEALLRALGADERRLLRTRPRPSEPRYVERDW